MLKVEKGIIMEYIGDILDWYISIVDKWIENDYNKREGIFSYLAKKSVVRDIVVSPNVKSGAGGLKSFLVTEILGIHRCRSSKVTYQFIQKYISEENHKKKYSFEFELLKRTVEKDVNRDAFIKESRIMQENTSMKEAVESFQEWIPYILLDEARNVAWSQMNNYYNVCTEKLCDKCKRKQQVYYQFTQAVALFEILYAEFVQKPTRECVQEAQQLVEQIEVETEIISGRTGQIEDDKGDIESVKTWLENVQTYNNTICDMLAVLDKLLNVISIYHLVEAEFTMDLCAMFHLILVLESVNVHDDSEKKEQTGTKLEVLFKKEYGKFFDTFERTNENKSVSYCRVNDYLDEILAKYTNYKYDIGKTVIIFLEELSKKQRKKKAPLFYGCMCLLALPVYKSLGGGKKIEPILLSEESTKEEH